MKSKKVYFHVIEYGHYGSIGYHDYYLTLEEAQNRVNDLSEMFPEMSFQVFTSTSKKEPPITTV